MSMKMLTIFQLIEIFAVYGCMTIFVPAVIFHKLVEKQRLAVRLLIYIVIGNFYMMNLVFFLQLIHISYRITIIGFTVIPAVIAGLWINKVQIVEIGKTCYRYIQKLAVGQMGKRTFIRSIESWIGKQLGRFVKWLWKMIQHNFLEWIIFISLTVILFWIYGSNVFVNYGYGSSDIIVHNYWINELDNNLIFADGVYPFGFHCVIYYLHTFFAIDIFVLLRLFWLVQTVYINIVLLLFLKTCCKSRYAAYTGYGIYVAVTVFHQDCMSRFYSSLPQEFGMIFILPSIYFAYEFFRSRKEELELHWPLPKKDKREKRRKQKQYVHTLTFRARCQEYLQNISESTWFLLGFAMSFSMTLAVHFYDAIIAGFFCAAIAVGFGLQFFRKGYFFRVIATFALSIFIAVLPMGIAYATGTPLQGSLNWGMNVIAGDEEVADDTEAVEQETESVEETTTEIVNIPSDILNAEESIVEDKVTIVDDVIAQKWEIVKQKMISYVKASYYNLESTVEDNLVKEGDQKSNFLWIILECMGYLGLCAIVIMVLRRDYHYTSILISSILYIGFILLLLGSYGLGLPELMDTNRCRIFVAYSMPILWSLMVDATLYVLFGRWKKKYIINAASIIVCVGLAFYCVENAQFREPKYVVGMETNGAIICLENIIHDNKNKTWTIVSANDEMRMGANHGYHYEIIDFLGQMEYAGRNGSITIPTHYVYFYIEKRPLDYTVTYENSGQSISSEGASFVLPTGSGLLVYEGENRWIIMSKMYYWVEAYHEMYPNEMKVYYEDDEFICYQIEQNDYSLNNFAIDYGYNVPQE